MKSMTIENLIKELQQHPNPKAKVTIVVGNEDDNCLDTSYFEVHAIDVLEYVELFVQDKHLQ